MKEQALSSLRMHFLFILCSSSWTPSFISPKDYDYSPVSQSRQPGPDRFFVFFSTPSSGQTQSSPQFAANTCRKHGGLRGSLLPSQEHFSFFHCGFSAPTTTTTKKDCDVALKGEAPWISSTYSRIKDDRYLCHMGIPFTEHSPTLNKYEQVEGLTKGSFNGFLPYEIPNDANYFCFTLRIYFFL